MTRQQAAKNRRSHAGNTNGDVPPPSLTAGTGGATRFGNVNGNNTSLMGNIPSLGKESHHLGSGSFGPTGQTSPAARSKNCNDAIAAAAAAAAALRGAVPGNVLPATIQQLMQNAAAMAAAASTSAAVRPEPTASSPNVPCAGNGSHNNSVGLPAPGTGGAAAIVGQGSDSIRVTLGFEALGAAAAAAGGIGRMSFPAKLHHMLLARPELHKECIEWTVDGRCIRIINPIRLQQAVLPSYFGQAYSYNSFANEMICYGFSKVTRDGNHECFYHDVRVFACGADIFRLTSFGVCWACAQFVLTDLIAVLLFYVSSRFLLPNYK